VTDINTLVRESNARAASRGRTVLALGMFAAFVAANACASSESTPGNTGGTRNPGTGGNFASGGSTGSGGATGTGGSTGGATGSGGTDAGTCVPHSGPPILDPATLPVECCPGSHCLAKSLLDSVAPGAADQLGDCETDGAVEKCVPDAFIASGGKFLVKTCRSLIDAEGRCLSNCIPQIRDQASRLPKDVCADGELCAPCFDPTTSAPTGACTQGCDSGPVEDAKTFPKCCADQGSCVPSSLVPEAQRSLLGTDTCSGANELCAPNKLAAGQNARPASCRSFAPQNREGRCLAACIPQVADRAEQLRQETCDTGELCAPCFDPTNGAETGACTVNGDAPVDPNPGPFVTCPAMANILGICAPPADGRCVPPYLVAPDQAALLCPNTTECQPTELCAPCVNPLDGLPTGACPAP
jgi:hypothetical protein